MKNIRATIGDRQVIVIIADCMGGCPAVVFGDDVAVEDTGDMVRNMAIATEALRRCALTKR